MEVSPSAYILNTIANFWPNPVQRKINQFGAEFGSDEYSQKYARDQFMRKVRVGLEINSLSTPIWGKNALELGCGHGGISVYLASLGFRSVLGVDVNEISLGHAVRLREYVSKVTERPELPVDFQIMDIHNLDLESSSFDFVMADNLFEHVVDPAMVLKEAHRVLKPGGNLVIPCFSSIFSKYGLHLKYGIKVPWANIFFSSKTIIEALKLQAKDRPELLDVYPGLAGDPCEIRDLRRHKDLNDITYPVFLELAKDAGFEVVEFKVQETITGKLSKRIPFVRNSIARDIFSRGASAVLRAVKPEETEEES
jgi:SAM-dependent methyltransferase